MRGRWRAWVRLGRVLACIAGGAYTLWRQAARWTPDQRSAAVQQWAARMLRALGVTLEVRGEPAPGPLMWVANHIAWLDILALHALRYCRFIAKSEVRHWPLIGPMSDAAGTLFIERASRRDALRVVHQTAQALTDGEVVAVFPEGTTSEGVTVLPFHANLLQAAIATHTPIQPVRIEYFGADGQRSTDVRYVGDDTLVASVWRVLQAPSVRVRLTLCPAQMANGRDRRVWAQALRQALTDAPNLVA